MSATGADFEIDHQTLENRRKTSARIAEVAGPIVDKWTEEDWYDYHSAVADVRTLSDLELRREVEASSYRLAFEDTDPETLKLIRLKEVPYAAALAVERKFRECVSLPDSLVAMRASKQYDALGELLRRIDQRVTLADLIERETRFAVIPGRRESHCGCPNCDDGVDRLILWPGFPSWGFCRQCGWKPSVIGMAAFLWRLDARSIEGLREIATRLAQNYLGTSQEEA